MVYLTFVDNHDDLTPDDRLGAAFNIYASFQKEITDVYIIVSPENPKTRVSYQKIAEKNRSRFLVINPALKVKLLPIELSNPTDFSVVYPRMLSTIQKIIDSNKLHKSEKIVNITSGTPTMTTCWVLLQQSGILKNAQLVQSFEPEYARERNKSYQIVEFPIDDFPKISAPETLRTELTAVTREKTELVERLKTVHIDQAFPQLIGQSKQIKEIKEQIIEDINENSHVLITGERGSGKEVVAKAIWNRFYKHKNKEIYTINCSELKGQLAQSELFGHKKGAFTGADNDKKGIIEEVNGRMLFFDEIGNMSIEAQQSLLRFLESGEYRAVGSNDVKKDSIQVIAATNKDINDHDIFAQDVKDRFDVHIEIPPLRERKEDIPLLIDHFMSKFSERGITITDDVMNLIQSHDWPDNVRGLRKWVKKLCNRFPEGGIVSLKNIPERYIKDMSVEEEDDDYLPDLPLKMSLDDYIEKIVNKAREIAGGKHVEVDRLLKQKKGVEKQRVYRKKKG